MADQYIDLFRGSSATQPTLRGGEVLIPQHLAGLSGPVLDLGCGPGHWTAYLHALGVEVTGVDAVPEFIDHARTTHPGPPFHLGSMTEISVPERSISGALAWYSTIHQTPSELEGTLAVVRRFLAEAGVLVIGFFDSDDVVASFDHAVTTAYRWPADLLAELMTRAGFTELERVRHQVAERPDRKFAAIAARAS